MATAPLAPSEVFLKRILVPDSNGNIEFEIRWNQPMTGDSTIRGYYIDWSLSDNSNPPSSYKYSTWFYYTPTALDASNGSNHYTFSISGAQRGQYLHLALRAGSQVSNKWVYSSPKEANLSRVSLEPTLKITGITDRKDLTRTLETDIDLNFGDTQASSRETVAQPYLQVRCFQKDLNISYGNSITLYSGDFYFAKKENGGDLSDLLVKSIYLYIHTGYEKFRYLIKFDDKESEYRDASLSEDKWVPWNPPGDPVVNFYNYKNDNIYSNKTIQNSGNLFYIDKDLYMTAEDLDDRALAAVVEYHSTNGSMSGQKTESGQVIEYSFDDLRSAIESSYNGDDYPYNQQMVVSLKFPFQDGAFATPTVATQYKTVAKTIYFLKRPDFSLSFNSAVFKPYLSEVRSLSTTIDLTGIALESASPISATLEYTTDNWANIVSTDKTLVFDSNNIRYETTIAFADLFEKQQNYPTKTNLVSATNTIAAKIRLKFEDSFGNVFSSKESNLTVDFSEHPKPNSLAITTSITDNDEYSYLCMQEGLNFSIGYTITGFPGLYFARVLRDGSHVSSQPLYQDNSVYAELGQTGWTWKLSTSEDTFSLGRITAISDNTEKKWKVIAFDSNRVDGKESSEVSVDVIKHIAPTITINSITATDKNNIVVNYTVSDSFNNGNGARSRNDILVWKDKQTDETDRQTDIYAFQSNPPTTNPDSSISQPVLLTGSIHDWDTKNFKIRVQTVTSQQGTKQSNGETVYNNYSKTKTVVSPEILVYNVVPTVSYRKNQIGINTHTPRDTSILDVHPTSTNKLIALTGVGSSATSSRIVINLEDMTIDIIEEPLTTP